MTALRKAHPIQAEAGFSWRGAAPNRLESLSDIVFGFALTLLVVSSAPPVSFAELALILQGAPGFLVAFAMLLVIWHAHYLFFRRYGLEDAWTMVLNALLLFLVLLFVYPLKFLAGMFSGWIGLGATAAPLTLEQGGMALQLFSAGYAGVFLVLTLLFARARMTADRLDLTAAEKRATTTSIAEYAIHAGIAMLVCAFALGLPTTLRPFAGFGFFLIGPLIGITYAIVKSAAAASKDTP